MLAVFLYYLRMSQFYSPEYMFGADGPRSFLLGDNFPVSMWMSILTDFKRRKFLKDILLMRRHSNNLELAIKLLELDKEKEDE